MKFEEILNIVGDFGWYQRIAFMFMILPALFSGIFMLMPVIILADQRHRCTLPGYIGDTYKIQNRNHESLIKELIPSRKDEYIQYFDPCHLKLPANGSMLTTANRLTNLSLYKCTNWVFDTSVFKSTYTSQDNLVCDRAHLVPVAMMIFYVGVFVGGVSFGFISDRIGRKKTLYFSILLLMSTSMLLTATRNFAMFNCVNFVVGMAVSGTLLTAYVLAAELLSSSGRLIASSLYKGCFAIGSAIFALVSYSIRDWRYIEFAVSLPLVVCFIYYRCVHESVRWLNAKGRFNEAEEILRKVANVNGRVYPEVMLNSKPLDNANEVVGSLRDATIRSDRTCLFESNFERHEEGKVWHLFYSRKLTIRTLTVFCLWFGFGVVYYGLSMYTDNLGQNFYLNFALIGLSEIPGYILMLILDRFGLGRITLLRIFFLLSGTTCLGAGFTKLYDIESATLTLTLVAKLGSAAACATVYLYTNEVMPTVVRNTAFGTSASFARMGTIVVPYIITMDSSINERIKSSFPLYIFGIICLLCTMVTIVLPETINKYLPETVQDAENME